MTTILGILLVIVGVSLVIAYITRFFIEAGKFLYNIAPLVVPLLIIIAFAYFTGILNLSNSNKDMKVEIKNAGNTQPIKDKGGYSRYEK